MKPFAKAFGKEPLYFDGAMGTMLQREGLQSGEAPETWNLLRPECIKGIHRAYLKSGCNIIKTNTFGANPLTHGKEKAAELVSEGVRLALEAVQDKGYVALDIGPTGRLIAPMGTLEFEDAVTAFAASIRAGAAAGADLVLIETMSDPYEARAALLAAKENCDLPVILTFTFDQRGKLFTGGDVSVAVGVAESLGADAVGLNCGFGPAQMRPLVEEFLSFSSLPVVVNPNAGLPVVTDSGLSYDLTPDAFAEIMAELLDMGVTAAGGCCGTTPDHLKALISHTASWRPKQIEDKDITYVTSYAKTVRIGGTPILIGERINPTGKPAFRRALKEGDMGYVLNEGLGQAACGAHVLDVNVGIPGIHEADIMCRTVRELQAVCDLPLQIDSSDPKTLEYALRIYNGRPLLNSVNGKQESLAQILPLAKKYGAVVVALTLDEDGIPETVQGRLTVAERILQSAAEYGIPKKQIVFDPLTMTISTGAENARITLETVRILRREWGMQTILGVSNVSFGLPQRERLNGTFFTMALESGLSAGIVNPMSQRMMDAYRCFCALNADDTGCLNYIEFCSENGTQPESVLLKEKAAVQAEKVQELESSDISDCLRQAVVRGLKQQAASTASLMSEKTPALEIIQECLIPALNTIGEEFESNRIFLPQLMMSAEAAKEAFDVLKSSLGASGSQKHAGHKIALATVQGDIHDIGKNIVKLLLESYGFEVLDLGKDVAPETVVQAVEQGELKLVGLSALMTTTVNSMERTIKMLREHVPSCKVMVGGAVLTEEYAKAIGADFYSPDAMGSVKYAETVFGNQ